MKNQIDAYKQTFIEEARELLAELESCLLELEKNNTDVALVDRIFRALHTIKGSGRMCGFDSIGDLAHEVETAYDLIRQGKAAVTTSLIDLTLTCTDHVRGMLGSDGDDKAGSQQTTDLIGAFRALSASEDAAQGPEEVYFISFRPAKNILLNGINPLSLLDELRGLGDCRIVVRPEDIPPLAEIIPENCYLTWEAVLKTTKGLNAIKDVFVFVEDDSELTIKKRKSGKSLQPRMRSSDRRGETASSIRVAADKLDNLVDRVGELVTVQARLSQTGQALQNPALTAVAEEVERLTESLRDIALGMRTLPIGTTFDKFRRLVRDLSIGLGTEAELVTEGEETELDKAIIEKLDDVLVHLIRNSLDHGIEAPQIREAAGKPRAGTVRLSANHSGAHVYISVSDDGAGLNAEAIRDRAIEKGLLATGHDISESDLFSLIFAPGFTTSSQVTDVSGRGVGMDVVKRNLDSSNGSIDIDSRKGEGTTITLKLPLTLAIIEGLLVSTAQEVYVMPLAMVSECVELGAEESHGRRVANVRGELIPYIRLREALHNDDRRAPREQLVIAEIEKRRFGFVVDNVIGEYQTVIKNMGRVFRELEGVSGATILGDGRVALILDPPQLVRWAELDERTYA